MEIRFAYVAGYYSVPTTITWQMVGQNTCNLGFSRAFNYVGICNLVLPRSDGCHTEVPSK